MPDSSSSPGTLLSLFRERVRQDPQGVATRHQHGKNIVTTTWSEWDRRSRTLAAALIASGVQPGDRVAIMSSTRVEWLWLDFAVAMAGAVVVPIFRAEVGSSLERILTDSEARLLVVEDPSHVAKVLPLLGSDAVPSLERVVYMDPEAVRGQEILRIEDVLVGHGADRDLGDRLGSYQSLRDLGEDALERTVGEIDRRQAAIGPGELATIAYTPGTEGIPKGVMLTHGNWFAASRSLKGALELDATDTQLLYLPLAHVFGRLCVVVGIDIGLATAIARGTKTVIEDCKVFQPTFMCSVPRLFEKVQEMALAELDQSRGIARLVTNWVGVKRSGELDVGEGLLDGVKRALADRLVYGPVRERFGGKLRFFVSAAAHLDPDTERFFDAAKLPILNAYGMTETCGATTMSRLDGREAGTVGSPVEGVEMRLAEDSELLVRGPMVTPGYWKHAEDTAAKIDPEGWFHTGDLFARTEAGNYVITDRKRDIILTATGKVIAPGPIVAALRTDPLIDQVVLHGDRRPYLTALISLDQDNLERFTRDSGLDADYEALTRHPAVYAAVEAVVARVNAQLSPHEQIVKFAILASELSTEAGELTPTRVVRRRVAADRHRALLDAFYQEHY